MVEKEFSSRKRGRGLDDGELLGSRKFLLSGVTGCILTMSIGFPDFFRNEKKLQRDLSERDFHFLEDFENNSHCRHSARRAQQGSSLVKCKGKGKGFESHQQKMFFVLILILEIKNLVRISHRLKYEPKEEARSEGHC